MMGLLLFSSYAGLRKRAKKFRSGKIAVKIWCKRKKDLTRFG